MMSFKLDSRTLIYNLLFGINSTRRSNVEFAITRLATKLSYMITGTMLLLDTTLPAGTDRIDTENTISIQKRIGQILALTLPMLTSFNPGYLVKFDERSAW